MCKLIVILDDNEAARDSLCDLIESAGFEVGCFGSARMFLDSDLRDKTACLIVDILMPKMSGLELQAWLKMEKCNVPIIFTTTFENDALRTQAMGEGAVGVLAKPFDHHLLLKTLRTALDT